MEPKKLPSNISWENPFKQLHVDDFPPLKIGYIIGYINKNLKKSTFETFNGT